MNRTLNDRPSGGAGDRLLCAALAAGLALLHLTDALRGDTPWPAALLGIAGWSLLAVAGYLRPAPMFVPWQQGLARARALARGSDRWVGGLATTGALCLAVSASIGLSAR